jgi:hypothetical protein
MPTLPTTFVLYIPTRKHLSSLVLLNCTKTSTDPVFTLTYPEFTADIVYRVKFDKQKPESSPYGSLFLKSANSDTNVSKRIFHMKDIHVILPTNVELPVLRFTDPGLYIQGSGPLVRNFSIGKFELAPAPAPAYTNSYPISIDTPPPYNTISPPATNYIDISGSVVAHIPSTPPATKSNPTVPPPVKRKKIIAKPILTGDLSVHVARKLMELAILKKEMCPITVEEFSAGNTAVMPCGHLFMQMAIEESFKKECRKCPECRQIGSPTYV